MTNVSKFGVENEIIRFKYYGTDGLTASTRIFIIFMTQNNKRETRYITHYQ